MTYILHNPDGTIKSYMDRVSDLPLLAGETISATPLSMAEYAQKFVLSFQGKPCNTISVKTGDPEVVIDVNAPDCESVGVSVNDEERIISLTQGAGQLSILTDEVGIFVLGPADRGRFCMAGSGSLCVEVAG